ncbi:MAG: hypothetical protein OQK82_08135, partial [Candidatus Pacearchaeota archaeon]|nr:hypothetical protein [Candidatus Pacearchaeota archaeon]
MFLKNECKADEKKFKNFIKEIKNKIRIKKIKNVKGVQTLLYEFIPASWKKDNGYIFKCDDMIFRKVILTPLMMDFDGKGYKGDGPVHYNLPPYKPIVEQVVDVFNGIKRYNKMSPYHLFEVYTFVGINPQNYDYIEDDIIPLPHQFQSLEKDEIIGEIK